MSGYAKVRFPVDHDLEVQLSRIGLGESLGAMSNVLLDSRESIARDLAQSGDDQERMFLTDIVDRIDDAISLVQRAHELVEPNLISELREQQADSCMHL